MTEPEPVFLGAFQPMYRGDVRDRFIDITNDLVSAEDEHIDAATFTVWMEGTDPDEDAIHAVATNSVTLGESRVDFQITVPAAPGIYYLKAVFVISDGQIITKTASLEVV